MNWEKASFGDRKLGEIIFRLFAFDRILFDFCFDPEKPRLRKRAGLLKEDAWGFSHGEQLLIRTALELWSGSGHVYLWELIETLDEGNLARVLRAVAEIKGIGIGGNTNDTP